MKATLRQMILDGRLAPGSQLMQQELAGSLGASVNLVREVLLELQALGLVTSQPGLGFTVRELSVEGFMEAGEVRAVLDGLAARLCCRRATRDDLADLKQLVPKLRVTGMAEHAEDLETAHALDRKLHDRMFKIAGNATLIRAKEACWIPMIGVENPTAEYLPRYDDAYREHFEIIAAIEEDRPDDAERLAREHRRTAMRRVLEEAKHGSVVLKWY